MSLDKTFIICLVMVQPRKTHPDMNEKVLTGSKESTNKTNKLLFYLNYFSLIA